MDILIFTLIQDYLTNSLCATCNAV